MKLHVWEHEGGLARAWTDANAAEPFFLFGRCGGGWSPFGKLDERAKNEARYCADRARERLGKEVELVFGPPTAALAGSGGGSSYALGIGGIFMLTDAILSMALSTDKRPGVQAGRVARAVLGLGFGAAALGSL